MEEIQFLGIFGALFMVLGLYLCYSKNPAEENSSPIMEEAPQSFEEELSDPPT